MNLQCRNWTIEDIEIQGGMIERGREDEDKDKEENAPHPMGRALSHIALYPFSRLVLV